MDGPEPRERLSAIERICGDLRLPMGAADVALAAERAYGGAVRAEDVLLRIWATGRG